MLKRVCELNGHLGFMVKEALDAYLQGSGRDIHLNYFSIAQASLFFPCFLQPSLSIHT